MKRTICILLSLALLLCLVPTALGVDITENPEGATIERLNEDDHLVRNLGTVKQTMV